MNSALLVLEKALGLLCNWLEKRRREQLEEDRKRIARSGADALIRLFNPAAEKE